MRNNIIDIARHTGRQLFGVSGLVDDAKAQWQSAIQQFQDARAGLDKSESDLYGAYDSAAADADDLAEWQSLFKRVNVLKSTMDAAANAVTTVANWWRSATGFFNLSGMRKSGALGNLSALPAFPITVGAILAFVASANFLIPAVAAFITYLLLKRDRVQQLIDAGVDPLQAVNSATDEAKATSGYSFGGTLQTVAMWAALAVAAYAVLPVLLKGRR
jgi:hypothetical protein